MGKSLYAEESPPPRRGLLVADGDVQAARPQLEPRPPRLLRTHPKRWTVLAGKVVPQCAHVHLRNGVHLVRQRADGLFSAKEAIADWKERGWTVIDQDVDGPDTSYLREVLPNVWLLRWEQEHAGTDHISADVEGYADWLQGLIKVGKVPPCPPYILAGMASRKAQEVGALRDAVRATPSRQPELDRAESDLAVLEAELARVAPATKRAPSPKRKLLADGEGDGG